MVFGTDRISFAPAAPRCRPAACDDAAPTMRPSTSFSQAAAENATSRVCIGFHFRHATEVGLEHGTRIGKLVATTALRPVP